MPAPPRVALWRWLPLPPRERGLPRVHPRQSTKNAAPPGQTVPAPLDRLARNAPPRLAKSRFDPPDPAASPLRSLHCSTRPPPLSLTLLPRGAPALARHSPFAAIPLRAAPVRLPPLAPARGNRRSEFPPAPALAARGRLLRHSQT